MMTTKIYQSGNSLGVYIPKHIAKKVGLVRGAPVSVRSAGRKIIVESTTRRETLQDLLSQLTPKNRQPLVDWGPDVGKEIVKWDE